MGKRAPSPPPAPDPSQMIAAQNQANAETARVNAALNRVNQSTPYGNITWSNPVGDQWNVVQTLSPEQQAILNQENRTTLAAGNIAEQQLARVGQTLAQPLSFAGTPEVRDGNDQRARVEASLFDRLRPQVEMDRAQLESTLANQGLSRGSQAWENAMRQQTQRENDARLAITAAGGAEQSRDFGQSMATRQQALQEILTQRQTPINETAALLGFGQVQNPQFAAVPQVNMQAPDVLGAYGMQQAGQLAAFNADNQRYMNNLNGMYQLGGSLIGGGARMFGGGTKPWIFGG